MAIQFLYYEDCPSHEVALDRLKTILSQEMITEPIEIIKVETDDQAQQLRFVGSPTFKVNGEDLFPVPDNAPYSLTCRAYLLDSGRISPLPTEKMLRRALRQQFNLLEQ